ncbi:LysR family transcriptional regulator [Paraburkholderia tropica]|uniref:LysR family transcriptional regulator n=1 Tax=Paraburkholderia tropica TaxID=92647 RepID=UPI002AAF5805|nr:LysR family transcriptional regulator [Paraburkholderia tropica]
MISPSNLDLQSLRIFVLAAHSGSLTIAAKRVYMTLSAVSKRVSELEQQTGHVLFERHSRGLKLTQAGEQLLVHGEAIVGNIERLVNSMEEFGRGVRGRVRIWANTSAIIQFLPNDLFAFRTLYPGIRIELEERLSTEITRALQAGDIDVGIVAGNTPAVGLDRRMYREDQLVLVARQDHPLAASPVVSLSQIVGHELVGTNHGSAILRLLTDAATALGHVLRLSIQSTSFEAIVSLVDAGHGVSVLPRAAVARSLAGRDLALVPISDGWAKRRLWIAFGRDEPRNPDAIRLVEHLAQVAQPST